MNETYNIVLADGTEVLANLNGNCYITETDIDNEMLSDENLSHITISGDDYFNYHCTNIWEQDDLKCFILRELTAQEKAQIKMDAKIEFIAMMCDIDIDF